MHIGKLPNYLKMYRKRSGLTQRELAFLLGCDTGSKVSRYERQSRVPNLRTLLGYHVVFDVNLRQLYTGTFHATVEETRERARALLARLVSEPLTQHSLSKIEFLKLLAAPKLPDIDPTSAA